jgi:hypothetical protein
MFSKMARHLEQKRSEELDVLSVIDIAVSFDGTWMKRGFTSLYGVGVCIDMLTGLVVDFHVRSKYCHKCKLVKTNCRQKSSGMERSK